MAYFVRLGVLGDIVPCRWDGDVNRGTRVVCRTPRGLEIGEVVSPAGPESAAEQTDNGVAMESRILRIATAEDEMLDRRLERHKRKAVRDCQQLLSDRGLEAPLLDVDHLFDGETLIFHFLGEVDEQVQALLDELAEVYDRRVRIKHFAKLVAEGCGPGCGESEGGCGTSGSCGSCAIAGACKTSGAKAE